MRISSFIAIAFACLLASSAFAGTDTSGAQQKDSQADPDVIVCKPGDPPPGSRLPGPRVCHTQREWDQMRKDAQNELKTLQTKRVCGSNSGEGMGGGMMRGTSC